MPVFCDDCRKSQADRPFRRKTKASAAKKTTAKAPALMRRTKADGTSTVYRRVAKVSAKDIAILKVIQSIKTEIKAIKRSASTRAKAPPPKFMYAKVGGKRTLLERGPRLRTVA